MLSQSADDRNRDVAYLRVRRALPTWEQVRGAGVSAMEATIRPGGTSRVKSARIKAIRGVLGDPLDFSLLAELPVEVGRSEARRRTDELTRSRGAVERVVGEQLREHSHRSHASRSMPSRTASRQERRRSRRRASLPVR